MSGNPLLTKVESLDSAKIDAEAAWHQLLERDPAANFFYAVLTTGVFCRPSCSSRRPLRENVRFFVSAKDAQAAGFRACKRCSPCLPAKADSVDKLRGYIEANLDRPVPLAELGQVAGLSPFTVQRLFKQAMGVSPLQYQRALRAGSLRNELKRGGTVTEAIYEAGFGSSSRAYEGAALGMTPSRFAQGGRGEHIGFATAQTVFGWMIVGSTARGLCWLALAGSDAEAQSSLRVEFPAAELYADSELGSWIEAALALVTQSANRDIDSHPFRKERGKDGAPIPQCSLTQPIEQREQKISKKCAASQAQLAPQQVDLRGTAFQLRVWQALRAISRGETRSYSQLAREMGIPNATRAVARACATNRVALVVPCHRVVGASGSLTGYRWGVERKRMLLESERGVTGGIDQSLKICHGHDHFRKRHGDAVSSAPKLSSAWQAPASVPGRQPLS